MAERMTKEELAEIRARRHEPITWSNRFITDADDDRRKLLAELDSVTRERDEALAVVQEDANAAAVRPDLQRIAEQRGFERCKEMVRVLAFEWAKHSPDGAQFYLHVATMARLIESAPRAEAIQSVAELAKPPEQPLQRDQNLAEAMCSETDSGTLQPVGKP